MKKQMMFCAAVLMLLTSGCVVVREYAPAKETVQVSKEEYTLARELLVAFVKNDGKNSSHSFLRRPGANSPRRPLPPPVNPFSTPWGNL